MSENIRVSEVSDILRQQLEGIETKVQLDEIGTVLQVSDGVVRIYGLRNANAKCCSPLILSTTPPTSDL